MSFSLDLLYVLRCISRRGVITSVQDRVETVGTFSIAGKFGLFTLQVHHRLDHVHSIIEVCIIEMVMICGTKFGLHHRNGWRWSIFGLKKATTVFNQECTYYRRSAQNVLQRESGILVWLSCFIRFATRKEVSDPPM